jgi:hypothetical protein
MAAKIQNTVDIPTKWIIIWLPNHGYQFPTSKSTWKPNFAEIGGFLYFGGHFRFKMATIANQNGLLHRFLLLLLLSPQTKFGDLLFLRLSEIV